MAQLIVRNLPDDIVRALKMRAAAHGRSAEEEHREILRRSLGRGARASLKDMLLNMPNEGADADFERPEDFGRDIEL